ncbi:hypothetical protein B8V81_2113 [Paenibacillus pasadenensis]|uniref:Uncharacterized protein n=1 Tax=Paenibacillus pasadenensis TaxID=217090 RepID=A0A2N5N045_9BACL|nr:MULTISPECIES: hypothetical protein [Paenibacillus]PLT43682.1 hypothetical protein B8V81_2113 [Paenibacillus pasadenensis]QGG54308.1 hypothetical protein GE073_00905 [Paenibacillus sp. B01]
MNEPMLRLNPGEALAKETAGSSGVSGASGASGASAPPPGRAFPRTSAKSDWRRLAFWMRTAACATLAFGLFQCVVGMMNFGLGTLAGLLEVAAAVWMLRLAAQAMRIEQSAESPAEVRQLSRLLIGYFRLQLLFTVAFGFAVAMLVLTVIQFLTDWDWAIHLVQQGRQADRWIARLERWWHVVAGWFE